MGDWKETALAPSIWLRGLFMLLYGLVNYFIVVWVFVVIAVFQFVYTMFKGEPQQRVLEFSNSLSAFCYQILLFLTFNAETKPFPFEDWPEAKMTKQKSASKKASDKKE